MSGLRDIRLIDRLYNGLWGFWLYFFLILLLSNTSKMNISEESKFLLDFSVYMLVFSSFIILICLTFIFIKYVFKTKIIDSPEKDIEYKNINFNYDAIKITINEWILINKLKLDPRIPISEKEEFISKCTFDSRIKGFYKLYHYTFKIPYPKSELFGVLIIGNLSILIGWILLLYLVGFGFTKIYNAFFIIVLHQFFSSRTNRKITYWITYFCIRYLVLYTCLSGLFGKHLKSVASASLMRSDIDIDFEEEPKIENEEIYFTDTPLNPLCPPFSLLEQKKSKIETNQSIEMRKHLENLIREFNLDFLKFIGMEIGTTVTRFIFKMDTTGRISSVTKVQSELSMQLGVESIRIYSNTKGLIIEIPNKNRPTIFYREIIELYKLKNIKNILEVPIGKLAAGDLLTIKIDELPHLLVAGATGSGKSVCINTIIVTLLLNSTPEEVKFILIDPKVVELTIFNKIPHLLLPVINSPSEADSALKFAVNEMEERYKKFSLHNVKNIKTYNEKNPSEKMPYIVIIIDELADLMMVAKTRGENSIETSICRLGQMARASGIHLIIGTQRPSADVITGLIKTNIPARMSFAVTDSSNSRIILDSPGAEKLLGKGDGLLFTIQTRELQRFQGAFISEKEVEKIVEWWTSQKQDAVFNITNNIIESIDSEKEVAVCLDSELLYKKEQTIENGETVENDNIYNDVEKKLLVLLAEYAYTNIRQYDENNHEIEFEIPWNREQLREKLSCAKASLQEALYKLTEQNIVRTIGLGRGTKNYFNLSDEECYNILKKYAPEKLKSD